ncbi:MAG: EAL domain-containing protein [Burkholderiaceae bacterium]
MSDRGDADDDSARRGDGREEGDESASDDDLIDFIEDDDSPMPAQAAASGPPWRVLVVDDDAEVHYATAFALRDMIIDGRGLELMHAYTGAEARELLRRHAGIAVVLLDVVMETPDAGLRLVAYIRDELQMRATRIVLRTGQPGYAPEMEVIKAYDINDYRLKAELTRSKLATMLISAVRSYVQIGTIEAWSRGVARILEAGNDLLSRRTLGGFCESLLASACELVGRHCDGMVWARDPVEGADTPSFAGRHRLVGASGAYAPLVGTELDALTDARVRTVVRDAAATRVHLHRPGLAAFVMRHPTGNDAVLVLDMPEAIGRIESGLMDLLCASAAVGLDNVRLFQRLHDHAYFDPLTGLANRMRFVDLVDDRIDDGRGDWVLGIVDIDHFSEINDGLGHEVGDNLLKAIARRLTGALGPAVTVARVAGDAFGVFGPGPAMDPDRLLALFDEPFDTGSHPLHASASMGLVRLSDSDGDGHDALKSANIGMKHAKGRLRGRYYYYTAVMEAETRDRVRLAHDLRRSMEDHELLLFYQPQLQLSTGRVVGAEALLRWRRKDGGFVPPDRFIPVAEYSGLIRPIGEWVLRTACRQLALWNERGLVDFRVGVNVSVEQFRAPGFLDLVDSVIKEFGVRAPDVELEITESMAMEEIDTVTETLSGLKRLGVGVAIDDFGTGFSSLGYLQQLEVDRLKIDRTFVNELGRGDGRSSIAQMIVRLGHEMGLAVIAEGVETTDHEIALLDIGCDEAQGYLYCKPMDVDGVEAWLARRGRLPTPQTP